MEGAHEDTSDGEEHDVVEGLDEGEHREAEAGRGLGLLGLGHVARPFAEVPGLEGDGDGR